MFCKAKVVAFNLVHCWAPCCWRVVPRWHGTSTTTLCCGRTFRSTTPISGSLSQRMCTRIRLSEAQQGHGKATQKIILRNPELTKRDGRPVRASGCAFYTSSLSQGLSLLTVPAHLH